MDVTTISGASVFQQAKITNNVQISVAAKVLDSEKTQGAGVLKLLESASQISQSPTQGSLDIHA